MAYEFLENELSTWTEEEFKKLKTTFLQLVLENKDLKAELAAKPTTRITLADINAACAMYSSGKPNTARAELATNLTTILTERVVK